MCDKSYKPVCGDNGLSYASECFLKRLSCLNEIDINVVKKTTCGMYRNLFTYWFLNISNCKIKVISIKYILVTGVGRKVHLIFVLDVSQSMSYQNINDVKDLIQAILLSNSSNELVVSFVLSGWSETAHAFIGISSKEEMNSILSNIQRGIADRNFTDAFSFLRQAIGMPLKLNMPHHIVIFSGPPFINDNERNMEEEVKQLRELESTEVSFIGIGENFKKDHANFIYKDPSLVQFILNEKEIPELFTFITQNVAEISGKVSIC